MSSNEQDLLPEAGSSTFTNKPDCFVIMPISDPDGYAPGHFKRVFEDIFKPACEKAGFAAVLASQVRQTNLIHLDILQKLLEAPMALCDLSSRNPNVLFELGLRQAFDKPVALVREEGTLDIFDIAPLRYTPYRRARIYNEVLEDQESITHAIKDTYEACQRNEGVNSIVRLLSLRPATLEDIRGAEKESALLQVIMAELSNLRSDVREIKHGRASGLLPRSAPFTPSKSELPSIPFGFDIESLHSDAANLERILEESINSGVSDVLLDNSLLREVSALKDRQTALVDTIARSKLGDEQDFRSLALAGSKIRALEDRIKIITSIMLSRKSND